jgi:TPR repeat protein
MSVHDAHALDARVARLELHIAQITDDLRAAQERIALLEAHASKPMAQPMAESANGNEDVKRSSNDRLPMDAMHIRVPLDSAKATGNPIATTTASAGTDTATAANSSLAALPADQLRSSDPGDGDGVGAPALVNAQPRPTLNHAEQPPASHEPPPPPAAANGRKRSLPESPTAAKRARPEHNGVSAAPPVNDVDAVDTVAVASEAAATLATATAKADTNSAPSPTPIKTESAAPPGTSNGNVAAPVHKVLDDDAAIFTEAVRLRDGIGCEVDKAQAVELLLRSAGRGHVGSMLALADLYCSGAVARPGTHRKHRTAALLWWDKALAKDPNNAVALCRKGEAMFQVNENTPAEMLQLAYELFDKAASLGSQDGSFLKGKWLVVMAPSHGDVQRAAQGKRLVDAAADAGLAKAYVFLGHCYEFPDNYKPAFFDAPKDKHAREVLIVSLYRKAASLGDPDGLNDIGSCYATGYGDIQMDFDKAVYYYERAIEAGSLVAYDNLGTHYETGMNGARADRIDFEKALHYYRAGAKRRCAKCSLNLGIAYEDGMGENQCVLKADLDRAEKYYRHAVSLAEDASDVATRTRASKDLAALYITRIKLAVHDSADAEQWAKRLRSMMTANVYEASMVDVHSAVRSAMLGRPRVLHHVLGEKNSEQIIERAREVIQMAREEVAAAAAAASGGSASGGSGRRLSSSSSLCAELSSGTRGALTHLLGEGWPENIVIEDGGRRRKRR